MCDKFKESDLMIRDATAGDMAAVCEMIQESAESEKKCDGPQLTVRDLQSDGFETRPPAFRCKIAELISKCFIIGYAIFFPTYSTWEGKALMLEDLFVRKKYRRHSVEYKLFSCVTLEAIKMGCTRLDFHVAAWNDARKFYEAVGAKNLADSAQWCYYRLSGSALTSVTGHNKLQVD